MGNPSDTITCAVITGNHPFDVPSFHRLFRGTEGVDAYIQDLDNFVIDWGHVRTEYDVVVFYNMHRELPPDTAEEPSPVRAALEQLGGTGQGIVVLHHAILAWPSLPAWDEITGVPRESFGYFMEQEIEVRIADPSHPITSGLSPWTMLDETYTMPEPGEDSHVLLTVDHPNSMKNVAWTRRHGDARVFCYQLGHDKLAWGNPGFCEVLGRGIHWAAGRL